MMKTPTLKNIEDTGQPEVAAQQNLAFSPPTSLPRPFGLLAELTYRCPLHCPYCSNPTLYPPTSAELTTPLKFLSRGEPPPIKVKNLHRSGRPPDRVRGTCGSTHRLARRRCEGMASVHVKRLEIVRQWNIPVDQHLVGRRTGHLVIELVSFTRWRH